VKKRNGYGCAPTPLPDAPRRAPYIGSRFVRVPDKMAARVCNRREIRWSQVPHPKYGTAMPDYRGYLVHEEGCTHGQPRREWEGS
jgi:hypothetical protein